MTAATLGSLFSGIGAFDWAAERVGMTVAWQAEIEPYACRVLAKRFPSVPNLGDVTQIETAPPVDVITAGFPCQDVSVAGKRGGLHASRTGLFFHILRLVREMREATDGRSPAFLVLENVPGLLSSHSGRDFAVVLGELAQLGAVDIAWRICDAQYVGGCRLHGRTAVPQRRRRVFVVCDFASRRAGQILALAAGGTGHPQKGRAAREDVAPTLAASVRGTGDGHGNAWNTTYAVRQSQTGANGHGVADDIAHTLDAGSTQVVNVAPRVTRHDGTGTDSEATDAPVMPTLTAQYAEQTGQDAKNGALVVCASNAEPLDVTRALVSPRSGSGGSYRMCDTESMVVADLAQITSKANRSRVEAGMPSSTLAAESQMVVANGLTASNGHHGHSSPRGDGNDNLVVAAPIAIHTTQDPISGTVSPALGQGNGAGCASIGVLAPQVGYTAAGVPKLIRRLMPVETERLMGLDDGWTCLEDHPQPCDCGDGARYRCCGNAVVTNVTTWLLGRVVDALHRGSD